MSTQGQILTDTGAVAALGSPWWLPQLHTASEIAAMVLPILGALWLSLQIGFKVYNFYRDRDR